MSNNAKKPYKIHIPPTSRGEDQYKEVMQDIGFNRCVDRYEEYLASQESKEKGLVEALDNIMKHIKINVIGKDLYHLSTTYIIAKQALAKYKEGK